jgi:two-component system, cell cycle response regulator
LSAQGHGPSAGGGSTAQPLQSGCLVEQPSSAVEDVESASPPLRVLLVEDDAADACLVTRWLDDSLPVPFSIIQAVRLRDARAEVERTVFDVLLLDMGLPDSQGLDTVRQALTFGAKMPIVVLTNNTDETIGLQALAAGAQDYVVKGPRTAERLPMQLRFAIERYRVLTGVRDQALLDPLTGLYNRRGFQESARRSLEQARRARTGAVLLFFDVDGFKAINDALGHQEGDSALIELAGVLRRTFRSSDLVARMSGDEFAVLCPGAVADNERVLVPRVATALQGGAARRRYRLTVSAGLACYDPAKPRSLEELLAEADSHMYVNKRRRHGREGVESDRE